MSIRKTSEIARRLAERDDVEPPEGLLEKIKAEIPTALRAVPALPEEKRAPVAPPRRRAWLMAASVAAAVCGGLLALQVLQVRPVSEMVAAKDEQSESAAAPQGPPAVPPPPAASQLAEPEGEADGVVAPQAPSLEKDVSRDQEETRQLRALGYAAAPAQPVEVPATAPVPMAPMPPPPPPPPAAKPAPRLYAESAPQEVESGVEGGVEGGVAGGVVGGVPGGVVGGVVGGTPGAADEPPLRIGKEWQKPGSAKRITVLGESPLLDRRVNAGGNESGQSQAGRIDKLEQKAEPSTGGTAEPNDQPYGDVFFRSAGVNPFVDSEDDHLSTFGLDVDTGSYTVARRYLREGHLPPPAAVRLEEFVNYFSYGDQPPVRGDFALRAEGAPTPFAAGEQMRVVRFNIRGREVSAANRKPAVLTFVVDVSGSMDMENRLGLVKQALTLLLGQLRGADRVGLVIYGDTGKVLLEPTSDHAAISRAIKELAPGGSTNAEEGLALAYDVAGRAYRPGAINRIILCTDGVANVGRTGPDSILERIGRAARQGIELTSLGFGMGNYNDVLLEQLADKGDGRYAYIDDLDEARRVLVEELTGTLQTIARDAKVQVDWNPAVVSRWRLLGYENRDIADDKFRDDTVDAGEIGAGHSVTALYEVKLKPGATGRIGTLHLRFRSADTREIRETTRELRVADLAPSWERAPASLRLASLVAELAEVLRGSYWAKGVDLRDLLDRSRRLASELADSQRGSDVADFVRMVADASRLARDGKAGERE
jgi:Ca-activated chloride channel family protein